MKYKLDFARVPLATGRLEFAADYPRTHHSGKHNGWAKDLFVWQKAWFQPLWVQKIHLDIEPLIWILDVPCASFTARLFRLQFRLGALGSSVAENGELRV